MGVGYLRGTISSSLPYRQSTFDRVVVEMYVNVDYVGNLNTRNSPYGYVSTLFGTLVCWKSSLQSVVALSTTQAEYIAFTEGVKEAPWLKKMIGGIGIVQDWVIVHCDSQIVIHLFDHHTYHKRMNTKIRLHFMRDIIESREVRIKNITLEENPTYVFTKSLARSRFKQCLKLVNFLFEKKGRWS